MAQKFAKITRNRIRGLSQGQTITEHGIAFERLGNGDGAFTVNIMVDGVRIHRTIGKESDGTTRTQAEEFIAQVRQQAKENRLNLPKGRKTALCLPAAAGEYIRRLENSGGRDLPMKRQRFRLHLVPFFGEVPISKIDGFAVERYKKHRQDEGAKPATINRELAALSHLFSKAEEWGWVDRRPAKIRKLPEGSGRIVYLTAEQANRLIEAAGSDQNGQIHLFIVIALATSMRRMEILTIRRENIALGRRIIYIPKAKAGAREQPITQHLADHLRALLDASDSTSPWLFPSLTSDAGHTVDVKTPFKRVVAAAGLDPKEICIHTLRHTAISHLVQAGVDLPTVKRISGHKTLAMVERYSHQNGTHIQAAMDALEKRYATG